MNHADSFQPVRDELNDIAAGHQSLSLAECHVFVDQTAAVIRAVIGHLPHRCAQHLARATSALATDELPKFIHEIEAAIMQAELIVAKVRRPHPL